VSQRPPSFDLVVATVGRTSELGRFLDSVEAQEYPQVRVLVVDQNGDDRLASVLAGRRVDVLRLESEHGLSKARNAALGGITADLVAFPDDDCAYPPGLLADVAGRLGEASLDGLAGRAEDAAGSSSSSWEHEPATLSPSNLWNRANAATVFLRRDVVERVGHFDEQLGLGSGRPWSSGEEIDYLIRAVRQGARVEYDPSLVVLHDVREDDATVGYRDGATIGYLLRKHGYPARAVARMLIRPAGGTLVALLRRDTERARYQAAAFRGRVRGLRAQARPRSSSKSAA
jgi:GT2 family glycosyltransferase